MYYKLIDATGHDNGIIQVNLETKEFEKLAKEYRASTGNQLTTSGIYQFLTKKGYAVVTVNPIEIPVSA